KAWLGMGGNVGDVIGTLEHALKDIENSADVELIRVSSFYRTPPWGKTDQNEFVNICCEIKTRLSPEKLLQICLAIEQNYGRLRKIKWGPRTLDIDLLAFEDIDQYHSRTLTLPHPLMTERAFVLNPLNEIAPELKINGRTVKDWKKDCNDDGIVVLPTHFGIR
ncbi:MAG: 2-amino-4-hydroxy-6-hydroxymethyldihydropteridine diphosphokinase, partial [Bifidobacteriales bacterium]|nr:2-amino-4-hydroxy-6-hydroxymethyldihydropteridine diphosphokinase [Bifidobacteriales bacterium]